MFQNILPEPGRKPGGVSVYVDRLAGVLAARGHEVVAFSYSPPPAGAAYAVRQLPFAAARERRIQRQYVAPWLLNFEDLSGFDVAHFHGDDWFFLRRRLPVVRTFHGSALLEARTATSLVRRVDKRVVYRLEQLSRRLATASYGVGTDSVRIYRADGLLAPGVDLADRSEARSAHPTILFVGTWSGRKRGALLHETFTRQIRPALPDAELLMVSDHCPAADGVRWIQVPSDEELSDLYDRAWAFCMPSSYEGFGIPYLEAMAHGTPVVATPNPGSEMLLERGGGIVVEDADLGHRLTELLRDGGAREAIADAGRARAAEYSWQRSGEHHESAYRLAIDRYAGRAAATARRAAAR